jgi:L-asparaginase
MIQGYKKQVVVITTGGTIDKTYDESEQTLRNQHTTVDIILGKLKLEGAEIETISILNKDSLQFEPEEYELIVDTALAQAQVKEGVIITHGTDRLDQTGDAIAKRASQLSVPIILTGAIRPFTMYNSDALQNLTESLLAVQVLPPGVYCVFHNRVLRFPGVVKDKTRSTFCYLDDVSSPPS